MTKTISAIALLLGIGIMVFTNPDREEYLQYASDQMVEELPQDLCNNSQLEKWFDFSNQNLTELCQSGIGMGLNLGKEAVKQYLDRNTQKQNLLLLSIYTTKLADAEYQTAGILGNFITYKKS